MVLKSFAKINLSLSVIKRLDNGLHDIQSLFCLINLFDTISIKKNPQKKNVDKIIFKGPFSKLVNNFDNSIKKTLNLMRKNKIISNYYTVKVNKRIPVFAGLGGGSSNAATVFQFLNKKKSKKTTNNYILKKIGSDLRLFSFDKGFLKNLTNIQKIKKKHKLFFLLVYPKIKCSTRDIYSLVKKYSKKNIFSEKNLVSKKKFMYYLINQKNDLQSIVEKKHPKIKKLIKSLTETKGCYFSRITGSGSTCYGLYSNQKWSKVALNSLRKKYPNYWFSIAKTI